MKKDGEKNFLKLLESPNTTVSLAFFACFYYAKHLQGRMVSFTKVFQSVPEKNVNLRNALRLWASLCYEYPVGDPNPVQTLTVLQKSTTGTSAVVRPVSLMAHFGEKIPAILQHFELSAVAPLLMYCVVFALERRRRIVLPFPIVISILKFLCPPC